jgi:hypothetical protein
MHRQHAIVPVQDRSKICTSTFGSDALAFGSVAFSSALPLALVCKNSVGDDHHATLENFDGEGPKIGGTGLQEPGSWRPARVLHSSQPKVVDTFCKSAIVQG